MICRIIASGSVAFVVMLIATFIHAAMLPIDNSLSSVGLFLTAAVSIVSFFLCFRCLYSASGETK